MIGTLWSLKDWTNFNAKSQGVGQLFLRIMLIYSFAVSSLSLSLQVTFFSPKILWVTSVLLPEFRVHVYLVATTAK